MKTGPTKESTKKTIVALDKHSTKSKKGVWKRIAKELAKPRRHRACVNIFKLSKMASKNKGKTLLVPGKVLSAGEAANAISVACLECSEKAREKIVQAKGKVMTFEELFDSKINADSTVIVK